jgi:hypothetical protein
LMNMLVGPIDYFASKINFLPCALHFSKTLKRTFSGIQFKMLKIWSFCFLNGTSQSFAVNYINILEFQHCKKEKAERLVKSIRYFF